MDAPRATRLVETVLRCYPARWRRRHGEEAAELAALLMRDGTPAGSVAWSYLAGAARERLTPRPGRRLSTAACALLVAACSLGVSAGLLASTVPATAASTSQARRHAHCRPGPPEPAPGVITAMSRPQVIIWEAGHGRSC
jgi:anti-sigma factor RsiW